MNIRGNSRRLEVGRWQAFYAECTCGADEVEHHAKAKSRQE